MNFIKAITAVCSLLFFMVGADKFLAFLEPPCSLTNSIEPMLWKLLGVMQIAAGILIWMPKYKKYVIGFFFIFMLVFSGVHLSQSTYDIGGSVTMAVLLGILLWNPVFLRGGNIAN